MSVRTRSSSRLARAGEGVTTPLKCRGRARYSAVSGSANVKAFDRIAPGTRIENITSALGRPLAIGNRWKVDGESVRTYVFAQWNGAEWVVWTREAWVLVRDDGTVLRTMTIEEP